MGTERSPIQIINVPMDLGASCAGAGEAPAALNKAGLSQALVAGGNKISEEIIISPSRLFSRLSKKEKLTQINEEIFDVCAKLATITRLALAAGKKPLIIGGDHSIAMGSVVGVASHLRCKQESLGMLWFDAHGDMNTPDTSPSGNLHGMPLAHLLGLWGGESESPLAPHPAISPEHVALIGVRDLDEAERRLVEASGVQVFGMADIRREGIREITRQALEIVKTGTAGFHLSFDVDGCDPAIVPGTGTLVPGGINLEDTGIFLEVCASDNGMLSMDVVELNPLLDTSGQSTRAVMSMIQRAVSFPSRPTQLPQ